MAITEVFKALSDGTRREILRMLRSGEMTAGEIAEHFPMSKPSLSHHFSVLKSADLITARREGQNIYYALNTTAVQDLLAVVMNLFSGHAVNGEEKKS